MATSNDQVSYPCLLAGGPDKKTKTLEVLEDAPEQQEADTPLVTPDVDQKDEHFQVGGPLWASILLFLTHCVSGFIVVSHSHVPFIGESPMWLRGIILIANMGNGFFDHCGPYIAHPSKFEAPRTGCILVVLVGLVLFFCHLYTALPAWESNTLLFLLVSLIAAPGIVYKNITGKDAPTAYGDLVDSFASWSGIALHLAADCSGTMFFILCWILLGRSH